MPDAVFENGLVVHLAAEADHDDRDVNKSGDSFRGETGRKRCRRLPWNAEDRGDQEVAQK